MKVVEEENNSRLSFDNTQSIFVGIQMTNFNSSMNTHILHDNNKTRRDFVYGNFRYKWNVNERVHQINGFDRF